MERAVAVQLIDQTFNQAFNPDIFTYFIKNLFNDIDESKGFRVGRAQIKKAFSDHIVSYQRLASYTDPQGEILDILVVKLIKVSALERARTMQRNFIASYLKQRGEKDAAIVAYFHPDSVDWRFSYVKMEYRLEETENGKIRVKEEFTPARRYSYLVGENEPNHTARQQLVPLLQSSAKPALYQMEQAFGIEPVTKEFFSKYKKLFLDLKDEFDATLKKDPKIKAEFVGNNIDTANFAKKLLGQIVFLYFLQKKGWLGVGKDRNGSLKPWGSGPKNFLKKLFNREITDYNNFFNDILEPLFYEALAVEHDNNFYSRFNCRIPFLNGGLFEPMNGYNWQETGILIDNAVFEEIFSVFNDYNFTVREDEPLEREVAVDPEMLGKVFENLLEVKDRKSRGAFYTPREIVHYMCRESLISHLSDSLPDIPADDLGEFVRRSDIYLDFALARVQDGYYQDGSKELPASILDQTAEIDDLLAEIKICDPAIGSGAFPVGMMTEIVRARQLLEVYLGRGQTAYRSKRHCIQESIYGVDIDSGAIDIAKLRLWLSLVVDEDDFAVIKPLPNLDYKIMQGNSLLEEFEGVKLFDAKLLIAPAQDSEEMLAALKRHETRLSQDYIRLHQEDALTKEKKFLLDKDLKKIHKSIKKLQQSLGNNGAHQPSLFLTTQNKAVELKKLHDAFFDATRKPEKERLRQEVEKLTFELIRLTLREQGREEALARIEGAIRTNTRPFFLWQLNFSEVFQGKGGFDVVIGNPPYVRHEGIKELKPQLKAEFGPFFRGTADLYTYFYKRGLDILHERGHLCYIAPNKFMRAAYGGNTRKFLTTTATPKVIIDFGDLPIFDATTYPAILLLKKGRPVSKSEIRAATFTEEKEIHSVHKTLTEKGFSMPVAALKQDGWNLEPPEVLALMDKLRSAGKPLGKYVEGRFYRGVLTGFNKAFIIDEQIREQLLAEDPKSDELIKPWVRGRDVKRWQVAWAGLYVINIPSSTNRQWPWSEANSEERARVIFQQNYPAVYQHLIQWEEELRKRDDQGKFWWELRSCAYYEGFAQPKIVYPDITKSPKFTWDESKAFLGNTAYIMPTKEKWLVGLLNTTVIWWLYLHISSTIRGGFVRFIAQYMAQLPIVSASNAQKDVISNNVERMLSDPPNHQVNQLEIEIDARVAHLYTLTEEEYNLILNKTNAPDLFRIGALNIFRDLVKGIIQ